MHRLLPIRALVAAFLIGWAPIAAAAEGGWQIAPELPRWDAGGRVILDDAARHRVLLVGGSIFGRPRGVVWARSTEASGRWLPLPAKNAPASLPAFQAILDARRDRIVIWDGSKLWAVTLGDTLTWSSRAIPQGPILSSPATAYDAAHDRMLLWSGYASAQNRMSSDLFALPLDDDAAVWSVLPTLGQGPVLRMNGAAIVDAANDRMIVHGGRDFSYATPHLARGDVWALSLSGTMQWTPLFTADSVQDDWYMGHAVVLDTRRQRMLVLGGETGVYGAPSHAEVKAFALDGSNAWSIAVPADAGRGGVGSVGNGDTAAYDSVTDAVFEYAPPEDRDAEETRRLALSEPPSWSTLELNEVRPPGRFGQSTAFDPVRQRWLSFGGRYTYYVYYEYPTTTFADLWSFALRDRPEWAQLAPLGGPPPERQDARMLYDADGDRMILFGGQVTTGVGSYSDNHRAGTPHFHADTWSLALSDPPVWSPIATGTPAPGPRDGHVMALDARRHRVLVFGGRDSLGAKGDLWSLSLDGAPAWSRLETTGSPPSPRWQAAGCYDAIADRLVIAGGRDATGALADAFELKLDGPTPTWSELATSGTAPGIESAARPYVFDEARRRLLLFGDGGDDADPWYGPPLKVWQLSLEGPAAWSEVQLDGDAPSEAFGSSAAMDPGGDRVALIGGANGYVGEYGRDEHWLLSLADAPSVVSAVLLSVEASLHRVDLVWLSPSAAWTGAHVERRDPGSDWRDLGPSVLEHGDRLTFTDESVVPGVRYSYRLHAIVNGAGSWTTDMPVNVPVEPYLVLGAPQPNPAPAGAKVSFTLPRPGRSELAVFDVGGRRRELHVTDAAAPGRFEFEIGRALEPGLYVIRVTQGAETRTERLCVLR